MGLDNIKEAFETVKDSKLGNLIQTNLQNSNNSQWIYIYQQIRKSSSANAICYQFATSPSLFHLIFSRLLRIFFGAVLIHACASRGHESLVTVGKDRKTCFNNYWRDAHN